MFSLVAALAPADHAAGSARFASRSATARLAQSAGLLIGHGSKSNRLLRYCGPGHLLTMAPTRSGKGGGTLLPNLLPLDRSIVCIDPEGENARIASNARSWFGQVYVLDPFGVTGMLSAAFNSLSGMDPDGLDAADEAASLADALVFDAPGEAGEAHWNEEAKALIGGLLLFIAAKEPAHRRHLATLRDLLTMAPPSFAALLARPTGKPPACSPAGSGTPTSWIASA